MLDRNEYERAGRAVAITDGIDKAARRTRAFTVCGRPLPGYAVKIRDGDGSTLPDRQIGRVVVKGPSLMTGYFGKSQETREVLGADGWLDTGDMGYLIDGELVITGRSKDLIIVKGRNVWPQDLEWAIERLPDVRSGSVAAFALGQGDEEERVAVVVECYSQDTAHREKLRQDVAATVHRTAGVHAEVVVVPPRSLPFTSSGKLSRVATRARYLDGCLKDLPTCRSKS